MDSSQVCKLLAFFAAVLSVISVGQGLNCYDCISVDNTDCLDSFNTTLFPTVECKNYTKPVCYKTSVYVNRAIMGKGVIETVSVLTTRMCIDNKKNKDEGCIEMQGSQGTAKFCICSKDGCNGSGNLRGALWAVAAAMTVTIRSLL